jgi:NAD kinase
MELNCTASRVLAPALSSAAWAKSVRTSASVTPPSWACDLAVVVGGDGTMLGIARELARFDMPLVGINQGRLGFITDIPTSTARRWSP